jgi:hypothetical protein
MNIMSPHLSHLEASLHRANETVPIYLKAVQMMNVSCVVRKKLLLT